MTRHTCFPSCLHVGRLLAALAFIGIADSTIRAQTGGAAAASADLFSRLGLTADEIARARGGQPAVRLLPSAVESEVAVAGAIRIRGDIERLVVWLNDMEELRRALGTDVVGAIESPARVENFSAITAADLDLAELEKCGSGRCGVRMPPAYAARLKTDVVWNGLDAPKQAASLVRQMLTDYAAAYQARGDPGIGALHDPRAPEATAAAFRDMLRRAAPIWRLAYDFVAYLEEFPRRRPSGVEDRFYWTRETAVRKPIATLHHVVMQRLPDRSIRFADKQVYASRDIDAALLIGQATPTADGKAFDLAIAVRARVPQAGSLAGRLLRNRIGRELTDTFAAYLGWLQRSFSLG